MNGLQAIKHMEKGYMVVLKMEDDSCVYKIEDDTVYYRFSSAPNEDWRLECGFDFSLNYEEYPELRGWERASLYEDYFTIDKEGVVCTTREDEDGIDNNRYKVANYFATEKKAKEVNFKQTLFRKLLRFADEHTGYNNTDGTYEQKKWFVSYNEDTGKLWVNYCYTITNFGNVYFDSEEVANKALETFNDELIKYFSEFNN